MDRSRRWQGDVPGVLVALACRAAQLRPRTRELYDGQLRLHILPVLGATELGQLSPSHIRTWRANMVSKGKPGASTVAKCYRLTHAILATAVEDGILMRNPCVVQGASTERPAERPVATIGQVFEIADAIAPELSAAVLLATFCGLRLGEIRALRQRHLDLLHRTVRVEEQYQELTDGTLVLGPPKTDAGVRTIAIPKVIIADLEHHLASVPLDNDGLLFTTTSGAPMRPITGKSTVRRYRELGAPFPPPSPHLRNIWSLLPHNLWMRFASRSGGCAWFRASLWAAPSSSGRTKSAALVVLVVALAGCGVGG